MASDDSIPQATQQTSPSSEVPSAELDEVMLQAFQIIAQTGTAKSKFIEAITCARDSDFERASELIGDGDAAFAQGHQTHMQLLQRSAQNADAVPFSLILMHSEDQLMTAESFRILAQDFIDVYKKMESMSQ